MTKIEKLTKKQEALIPLIRQEWIDLVSSGKEINKKAVTNWVNMMYSLAWLKEPKIISTSSFNRHGYRLKFITTRTLK